MRMAQSNIPRIAVAGCGHWGKNHARNFANLGVLKVVVDIDNERAEELASLYGTRVCDWETVLRDCTVDAVVLATPARNHASMAIQALDSGKHVLVEKPLSLSLEEAQKVAQASKNAGKIALVGHQYKFHPAFLKLQSMIREGRLGRLQYVYSNRLAFGQIRHNEDVLWSFAPHDISMILGLVEEVPSDVQAHGSQLLQRTISDIATTFIRFPSGAEAQVFVSWMHPFKEQKLIVIGEDGMALFDDQQPWEKKLTLFHSKVVWNEGKAQPSKGDADPVVLEPGEPLAAECQHFVECIKGECSPLTSVQDALDVVEILSRSTRAMSWTQENQPQRKCIKAAAQPNIHETAVIDQGCTIGQNTRIWHFSHILTETHIGTGCNIGQNVMIGPKVLVGNRCKIQNNVSVYPGVILEDGVFCGPSCVFTNVLTPRAEVERKAEFQKTMVRRGSTIGANSTVICGNELGEFCMIGAGAVVTKPVPPYALVVGNPAKRVGWVSAAGERLGPDLVCPRTGQHYREVGTDGLVPIQQNGLEKTAKPDTLPFINLRPQKLRIKQSLNAKIAKVLDDGQFVMGAEVLKLEHQLHEYTGAAHVISCASGTDALTLSLLALDVKPGDAVLVPAFTYVATAEVVPRAGAVPVFVDIERSDFTMNPDLVKSGVEAAQKAGLRPVGIISVDLFGNPAKYDALNAAAEAHGLWIIADAAQSIGASYKGHKVGKLAKLTATSFFPSKPLGCYGDGGAVFTDDQELAEKIRSLRVHGRGKHKFDSVRIGLNSRLDTIQAAVLLAKLEIFQDEMETRKQVASRYSSLLDGLVETVSVQRDVESAWAQYTMRSPIRDTIKARLHEHGIPSVVYYPTPLCAQDAYGKFLVANGTCPIAEQACNEVLSLPMDPYLEGATQQRIVDVIKATCAEEQI